MSDYDSSMGESQGEQLERDSDREPFHYDYYLSNSVDVFESWKGTVSICQSLPPKERSAAYLQRQFREVCCIQKFRTADLIRANAFVHKLRQAFVQVSLQFTQLFDAGVWVREGRGVLGRRCAEGRLLEQRLRVLLGYLQVVMDQSIHEFEQLQQKFQGEVFEVIFKLYSLVVGPKLLWDISGAELMLMPNSNPHPISLGGNHSYYKNIMRSMLKRNWQLKDVYERLLPELRKERLENFEQSQFLTLVVSEVMSLETAQRLTDREKREFIDCMKGLFFLSIELRSKSVFYDYLLTSFHLEVLTTQRMFKDYEQLQGLYITVLRRCKEDASLMDLVYTLEMDKLSFQKRRRVPEIELEVMEITCDYIAVVKGVLGESGVFAEVAGIELEKGLASSRHLLEHESLNGLVGLLMAIQENSKDAFSQGDIAVHKIYLRMSEMIKQIYLSYQHDNWLFPTDILLYIPLRYFIDISDDIRADVKKALFTMVEAINQDRMPSKVRYVGGRAVRERVTQAEYLQVILYFLLECHSEEEYINLPEIIPVNLQTSILYIKSLELKLNDKQPTPDQMPYVVNMLRTCENYKLNIKFRWYEAKESIEDREIEFNIEKGLSEDWMRKIYRETINAREIQQIKSHFDKYKDNKGLTVLNLASIFKYCHALNPGRQVEENRIREEDLFTLLQEIKMLLSIHFDIFNLNLDEEISLSYIHVCLGFYNSCLKETPFNEVYIMIMESIMKPFLRTANSSLSRFKTTYPGFFEKWLYSFQINAIFSELGSYISEKGQDESCREDIINKIKMVREFIDNKDQIQKTMKIEELTEIIVLFATLISRQAHPLVYIESVELFCLFLNTFPQVRKMASLDFMLDASLLSDQKLVTQMLEYIKNPQKEYKKQEVSMLNSLIDNLADYQESLGLKMVNQILKLYVSKQDVPFNDKMKGILQSLFTLGQQRCSFLVNVNRLIFLLKDQHQIQKDNNQMFDILPKILIIQSSLQDLQSKNQIKAENVHFSELMFIEDVITKISKKQVQKNREGNIRARKIFHHLIKRYGSNDDLIFFAEKLDFFDLILMENKVLDAKEEALLIDLIIQNKQKGNATELIKKLLRESRKLSEISEKVIDILSKQKDKIHSHHINKFIHINNRYPKEKIQQFLIENIGCERNIAAVKINQQYLVKDLAKKLQKVPKNICEQLLLKPIKAEEREKLIDFISDIFQKLLYLPIKRFENVDLKPVQGIHQQNQDWNTDSQGQHEQQTKQQKKYKRPKSQKGSSKGQYNSNQSDKQDQILQQQPINEPNASHSGQSDNQDSGQDYDKPPFLQMFTDEGRRKQLQLYEKIMIVRQELDVLINSRYELLVPGSDTSGEKQVVQRLIRIAEMLNQMQMQVVVELVSRMPQQLYQSLRMYGLAAEISPEMSMKMVKRNQVVKKAPKWMVHLFSDRSESDDSNIVQNQDDDDDDQDDSDMEDPSYYDEDDGDSDQEMPVHKKNKKNQRKQKRKKFAEDESEELPGLLPTHSKIEQEISGSQLKRDDIIKILEISLYWLLHLPESQIKTKHVTSYYMQILQSNMGQMFFQSFMTVIRFDETNDNLQSFVKKLADSNEGKIEIGLQEISMENAINNILYFIRQYEIQSQDKQNYGNILFKESGTLVPIAEDMLTIFDLPVQNNCITLLLIYIQTNKAKIRNKISQLNYRLVGNELPQNKTQYRLKYPQMVRIIKKICKHGSNNKIWDMIQEKMNLKVKSITKTFSCIKGYGSHLYKKLSQTGQKVFNTIKGAQKQYHMHYQDHEKLHNLQNTYHILSKLVLSCKQQIKQFYYINKSNLKKMMEEQSIEIYQEMQSVQTVPTALLKNKYKIFQNKQLIRLVQAIIYFIKMLKDQFYGKIQDKMFSKLIHYPKMIIQSVWYYIFIFAKHQEYKWTTPSQIEKYLKQHPYIGSYQFNNLQQAFNLVIYYLNLQSFCTDKFKQFFLPILMKNPQLARQITLMFKVPKSEDNEELVTQSILVTRKCSFDMAFYQVTGQALQVQFFGEEGSDHGGLIRELMIGWKGRGVGQQAFFIGKILGISFNQGVPYGGTMDIGMFVAITNFNVTIQFFEDVDPEIYKSLKYIRDNDPESLSLRFVVQHNLNGRLVEYELIEGGKEVELVEANKFKFLEAYLKKYFYLGRQRQLKELKHGFNTVVYPEYAEIFTPYQMLKQIRGQQVVDVKMLISKARYQGYSSDAVIIKWFWEIVETFDQQKMNTFIQFVTGSPKITIYNSNFSITIDKAYEVQSLPVAHTCFNTIDLPEYSSKEILEKKLLTAIFEGNNSFGIL